MQYLTLALLLVLVLLVVQLLRRIDEIARTIHELKAEIKRQAEAAKVSEKPRY